MHMGPARQLAHPRTLLVARFTNPPPRHPTALQVCVRCEEISISGGLVRQKAKYERFLRKGMNTNPRRTFEHFRSPSKILWRTVRGENAPQACQCLICGILRYSGTWEFASCHADA